jgi:hypothetical protein
MTDNFYADCHLFRVSFYSKGSKIGPYAGCHFAECLYAVCHGAKKARMSKTNLQQSPMLQECVLLKKRKKFLFI